MIKISALVTERDHLNLVRLANATTNGVIQKCIINVLRAAVEEFDASKSDQKYYDKVFYSEQVSQNIKGSK